MSNTSTWQRLLSAIAPFGPAVRVKWSGDEEPTRWEPWVGIPASGYLETGTLGPVPFREVEWVEIDPTRKRNVNGRLEGQSAEWRESLVSALIGAALDWSTIDGKFRISGDAV